MKIIVSILILGLILSACLSKTDNTGSYDLVIYGGTPAGITAAIQAMRMGHSAVLINPNDHIGGATTGGLTWTDYGQEETIGGLADEFYVRIKKYYDDPSNWKFENQDSSEVYNHFGPDGRYIISFEPSVALRTFLEMLDENNVKVIKNKPIQSVHKQEGIISGITTHDGTVFNGRLFIDASYEGDLMALSKVSYHVGRESESQYNEDLAGVLGEVENYRQPKKHFGKEVNPFDENGNLNVTPLREPA